MPKREWLSREHHIYRISSGAVYARLSIPSVGQKEITLEKRFTGPIESLDEKTLRSLILAKDKAVAEIVRSKQVKSPSLYRFEEIGKGIVESKRTKAFKTFESADITINKHLIPFANEYAPYLYEWGEKGETLWQKYIDFKRTQQPGMKFMNHRKHLSMVLLRAFERRIIDRKIKLYDPDPEVDVGRVLEYSEIKKLYAFAQPALKTQIMMAFSMGLRKSEILRLAWDRVDFESNEIVFTRSDTKTRKPRLVPMNVFVRNALASRKTGFEKKGIDSPWVFPSRTNKHRYQASNKSAWTTARKLSKVAARFHDLRHTFITNAVRSGMNPILICKYAGLSQDVMMSVYCHLDTRDLNTISNNIGESLGRLIQNEQEIG